MTDEGGGASRGDGVDEGPAPARLGRRSLLVDAALGAALLVASAVARRHAGPDDGLLYDDAWVVAGASEGGFGDLLTVSTNHPGFTALLMGWSRLVSRASESFALPALAAGALGATAAYLALRTQQVRRAVALSAAALVVAAPVHVMYSGRVKPYVIETLAGFLLTALVPWAAARRWSWGMAAAWVVVATVVGSTSALLMVITGVATLMVAAHPLGDRVRRLVVLGAQGALQAGLLLRVQRSFDSSRVAREWESTYDGYIELDEGPGQVARQLVTHVSRLGRLLVSDIGSAPAAVLAVVAVGGLLLGAWRGERRVAARMHLAFLAIAFVGGLLRQLPFGPSEGNVVFPGGRANLWLLPALVVGLALAADAALDAVGTVRPRLAAVGAAAVLVLTVTTVGATWETPRYLPAGMGTAARLIDEEVDADDVVLVHHAEWPYGAEPSSEVAIVGDRTSVQGFELAFTRPGTHLSSEWDGTPASMRRLVGDADRVVLLDGFLGVAPESAEALADALRALGFRDTSTWSRALTRVTIWDR